MNDWREDFMELVFSCTSEHELFNELTKITCSLGFEFCSYGLKTHAPLTPPHYFLFSNYPSAWEKKYVTEDYFSQDPTVEHGLTRSTPLRWCAEQQHQSLAFWEEARHYNLNHGWCLSSQREHNTTGLLSVSRADEYISTAELESKEVKLIWLTQLVHESMTRFLSEKPIPEQYKPLTAREKETLKWTAMGKTYVEISIILNIDTRTVKFHVVNSMRKLQASNKTEAAVKASLMGLLF
ncbi:autoinducer binding domain-containing protein [Pseudomonas sp. B21-048]|uniref:autoinducer binding domain-containing protein n=1 Tax=Pseudomonas sp. B21-048 TaxID=2895490 RepID=UPI00215EEAA9|nr:autoinducer binding domain-containing protein [Pseudomonas sp. B21-048]UVK96616.1 autoinducer binding domain-containing protein [Pseudomonas sp. B21-048]